MAMTYFDLSGDTVAFDCADDSLLAPFRRLLGPLETPQGRGRCSRWSLAYGPVPEPPPWPVLFEGPLPTTDLICVLVGRDGRYVLTAPGHIAVEMNRPDGTGSVTVAPGSEALLGGDFGMNVIDAALAMTGQTLIHGAALVHPLRKTAFMLVAPSGAGKTTTAIALASQGLGLITDDTCVVRPRGGALEIWGLPRKLKVHSRTADLMPWLKPYLTGEWDSEGEQALHASQVTEIADAPTGTAYPLSGIVWLGARVDGPSRLERLDKADLLVELAADNLRRGAREIPDYQLQRFGVLSDAVRANPTYALHVGSRVDDAAAAVADLWTD